MKPHALIAALIAFVSIALPTPATAVAEMDKDRSAIEGVWHGYVVEGTGENPDRGPVHLEISVTADMITAKDLKTPDKSFGEGTFALDADESPKTLDATGTAGQEQGKSYRGIYAIDGDTLKWCVGNPGRPRPSEFVSKFGSGQFLMILQRQKSEQPRATPESLQAEIESLRPERVAWREIAWKPCLLDGLRESREQAKPVLLWIFIDRPADDARC